MKDLFNHHNDSDHQMVPSLGPKHFGFILQKEILKSTYWMLANISQVTNEVPQRWFT